MSRMILFVGFRSFWSFKVQIMSRGPSTFLCIAGQAASENTVMSVRKDSGVRIDEVWWRECASWYNEFCFSRGFFVSHMFMFALGPCIE